MSSIAIQFLDIPLHHDRYPAIDPENHLARSAEGKTAFISGASSGIGRATAIALAKAGAAGVFVTARSAEGLKETVARVRHVGPGTGCAYQVCDVTDEDQVKSAVAACAERFGGIDIVHANAGYLDNWRKIGESAPSSWWRSWEVNLKGAYLVARYSIPHLLVSSCKFAEAGRSSGHLILMSSVGAQLLTPGASDYQTAKHALNRLYEFINVDHGDDGLKCFAIHPGGVPTDLALNMPAEIHCNLTDKPELAAGFVVWLCSGQADWARGRYLNAQWDVDRLCAMREEILTNDLLVNRLRVSA